MRRIRRRLVTMSAAPRWRQRTAELSAQDVRGSLSTTSLGWELSSKHGGCPTCFSSFGIWDIRYPLPRILSSGCSPSKAFAKFLAALERSLQRLGRRPQVFWLSVTAVADARLPEWKRPRMSAALSQRYNAIARPLLEASHIQVIDTYTSGHAHPEQSVDGVHFAAPISRHHAQLFWQRLCTSVEEDFEMGQRPFERRRAAQAEAVQRATC